MFESTSPPAALKKVVCVQCYTPQPEDEERCPYDGAVLAPDPWLGKTFAQKYEVLSAVLYGGMSITYEVQSTNNRQPAQLRVFAPLLGSGTGGYRNFLTMAQALASVKHPNVVELIDYGVFEDCAFAVRTPLRGTTVKDMLQTKLLLPVDKSLHIFLQVCDALMQIHKHHLIHRDFRKGSIMIVQEPNAADLLKVTDFGFAKLLASDIKSINPECLYVTAMYASPEECQSKPVDLRSDVYSMGCVMYQTFTGAPPHVGISLADTMKRHVEEPILPMRGIAPELVLPDQLDAVIMKALEKNPSKRQLSMEELKGELIDAARLSRIYVEGLDQTSYQPEMFRTGGERTASSDPLQFQGSAPESAFGTETLKSKQDAVAGAVKLKQESQQLQEKMPARQLGYLLIAGIGLFIVLLFLFFPNRTRDLDQLEQARTAIHQQRYRETFDSLKSVAGRGHRQAQCLVGLMYERGIGVKKDLQQAAFWYERAAQQGFADARNRLSQMPGYQQIMDSQATMSHQAVGDQASGLSDLSQSWEGYGDVVKSLETVNQSALQEGR